MLAIDTTAFCNSYVMSNPGLSDDAQFGLERLANSLATDPDVSDIRWAAYMLATVKHECANRWQPIEEFGRGQGKAYGVPAQVQDSDGTTYANVYYGRGYVQLTWKMNYDKVGRALGMGNALLLHPEHALEPETAYRIMSFGMRTGLFTGKKLSDYINHDCDYLNARRIINVLDKAPLIQGYAQAFERFLRAAGSGSSAPAASVGSITVSARVEPSPNRPRASLAKPRTRRASVELG